MLPFVEQDDLVENHEQTTLLLVFAYFFQLPQCMHSVNSAKVSYLLHLLQSIIFYIHDHAAPHCALDCARVYITC